MWNARADEVWSGDLPQETRVERLHEMLDAHAEAFEGAYAAALVRVGLLYAEGRADEALAALLEAVDSFPDDPGPGLVDARLAVDRGELERAETSLASARRATGESCRTMDVAAELARARGDEAAELSWLRSSEGCEPSRTALVAALVRASRSPEADEANRRGVRVVDDVLHFQRWRMLEDIALGSPSADGSARGVLRLAPGDEQATRAVYDALLAQGREDEASAALDSLVPLQPGPRIDLRLIAEGRDAGWPLRESGLALVLGHEARGTDDDPPRLAVLDQVVARLYADGSSVLRVHRLERAGTPAAADALGQVDVPAGALILALRTLHADGAIEYAGDRVGATAYPLLGFGAGDYAEVEYVLQRPASSMFPGGTELEPFYFSATDESLARSEYVILAPPSMDLSVDAGPGTPGDERSDIGGLTLYRWAARDVRPQVVEPWAPDAVDVLPNVRACVGCTTERAAAWLGSSIARRGRGDPGMARVVAEAQAAPEGAARALYRWVVREIRSAPQPADTARDAFLRGQGDRSLLLAHLAGQAGLDAELWYASPASRGMPAAGRWFQGDYVVPLVRIGGQWLYAEEDAVPFGALPPNVGGQPAVRVSPAWAEEAVAAAEDPPSEFRLEAFAGAEGGAEVEAEARLFGLAATAMRQALAEEGGGEPPEELVRVYALPVFDRDASIVVEGTDNVEDVEAPLVVRAHVRLRAGPRGRPEVSVRHRWQDRFALMVQRTQPLLLPVSVREEWTIVLRAGAGEEAAVLPLEIEAPFGSFRQWLERGEAADALIVRRSLRLPAQRIEAADYDSFRSFAAAVDAATEPAVPLLPLLVPSPAAR